MQTSGRDIIIGTVMVMLLTGLVFILPVIGSLTVFLVPLPIIYYRVKSGQTTGFTIAVASLIIVFLLARRIQFELIVPIQLFVIGVVQGEGLARRYSLMHSGLLAVIITAAITFLWVLAFSLAEGITPVQLVKNFVSNLFNTIYQMLNESMAVYQQQGLDTLFIEALKESLKISETRFITLSVGYVLMSIISIVWANLVISRYIFIRKGLSWAYGSLNTWRAPEALVYIGVFGALLALFTPGSIPYYIGVQVIMVCMTIYCLQGIAILSFIMIKRKMYNGLQAAVYVIIAILPMMIIAVAVLGVLDILLGLRGKNFGKTETKPNFN